MKIKKLLYESFERALTNEEEKILAKALACSEALRNEKENIIRLRESLSINAIKDFTPGFEERVLQKINSPKAAKRGGEYDFFNSLSFLFRKIVYATIIIVILSLSYNFTKYGQVSLKSALGIQSQKTSLAETFYNSLYSIFSKE